MLIKIMDTSWTFSPLPASKHDMRYIFGGVDCRRPRYALPHNLGLRWSKPRQLAANVDNWHLWKGVAHWVLQLTLGGLCRSGILLKALAWVLVSRRYSWKTSVGTWINGWAIDSLCSLVNCIMELMHEVGSGNSSDSSEHMSSASLMEMSNGSWTAVTRGELWDWTLSVETAVKKAGDSWNWERFTVECTHVECSGNSAN